MVFIYTSAIFVSAFLIFLIQPMMAKILLPYLGGTYAVWNTSMVFYQLLLLGGYLYAHLGLRFLGAKRLAIMHIALLLFSLIMLPLALNTDVDIVAAEEPVWWLLSVLFLSVGLPFFLLSANAPLLQSWFASTSHEKAANPYFLYAASNLGSFIALLGYPILFEPFFSIPEQLSSWSGIYVVFIALLILCSVVLYKYYLGISQHALQEKDGVVERVGMVRKLHWIALAFIPSSMMLGVTTYITMDITSIPLLWVIPFALYLLTFILAFSSKELMYERSLNAQVSLMLIVSLLIALNMLGIANVLYIHLFMFFATAMVCHGQLAKDKPSPTHLTEFFLLISVGGVLGGMFNALLAPVIFDSILEYQIVLILACFFRPVIGVFNEKKKERVLDVVLPVMLFLLLLAGFAGYNYLTDAFADSVNQFNQELAKMSDMASVAAIAAIVLMIVFAVACAKFYKRPVRFGLAVLALSIAVPLMKESPSNILHVERNFFGVLKIQHFPEQDYMVMKHGTTVHGIQRRSGDNVLAPTTYYGAPLKEIFSSVDPALQTEPVGLVGLGVGTVACYGQEGQKFDFYEINEAVKDAAWNPDYFSYLADCPPDSRVIIGDGRIELAKADDGAYGVIIMDAFSSDSIPIHLITTEALRGYLTKLKEGGIIAFHISSRHLNLEPVLSSLAEANGLSAVIKKGNVNAREMILESKWVVLAQDDSRLNALRDAHGWVDMEKSDLTPWTDNYSNIIKIMMWE